MVESALFDYGTLKISGSPPVDIATLWDLSLQWDLTYGEIRRMVTPQLRLRLDQSTSAFWMKVYNFEADSGLDLSPYILTDDGGVSYSVDIPDVLLHVEPDGEEGYDFTVEHVTFGGVFIPTPVDIQYRDVIVIGYGVAEVE